MKLIWKGKYSEEHQLPKADLPDNAVKFKEPETPAKLNLAASIFIIPVFIIILLTGIVKAVVYPDAPLGVSFNTLGILLAFATVIPHELLHAVAFPKQAEVQLWYSPKNLMAFVYSSCPMSKLRFIFLSLLPNVVFGFIPLILWVTAPFESIRITETLFSFATFSLLFGVGDYLNVYNAVTQMPKNSITQLSGFHSYWYLP